MCIVSNIGGYYGREWWDRYPERNWEKYNYEQMKKLQDLIESARKMDQAAKEPECENPDTKKILVQILERLTKLEEQAKNK